jgi:molybdate transport system permease protein
VAESQWEIVGFTVVAAGPATVAIFPFGVSLAWLLARRSWPGKSIVETLVALPLVMPPVATGLILLKLLGRKGSIGGFFHDHFEMDLVFTWRAVVIAMAVMSLPLSCVALASPLKPSAPVSNKWPRRWEHRHCGSS